jgi:murein DD-endopeptidase MepM/ murein hydrolase activator NlpD
MKILPQTGHSFHGAIEELKGRKDPEAVRAVAKELEALFAYEMIKAMRETSEMTNGGFGKDTFMSMFDMELSRLMADRGLGLKEMLFKGMQRQAQKGEQSPQSDVQSPEADLSSLPEDRVSDVRTIKPFSRVSGPKKQPEFLRPDLQSLEPVSIGPNMPVDGRISSKFGLRKHPIHGDMRFHHGMDIAAPEGTEVYPLRGGKVIFSGQQPGYGNAVVIDHGDGYVSKYAHNKVNLVKTGDPVDEHTAIAQVGSTGLSTGPHLHFEVRADGKYIDPAKALAMK